MFTPPAYLTPKALRLPPRDEISLLRNRKDFYFSKDGFRADLELHDFKPSEVTVKTVGSNIIIQCEHDERTDSFSAITRKFVRKFFLPESYDPLSVKSTFSSDGVLTVTANLYAPGNERVVPVQQLANMKL